MSTFYFVGGASGSGKTAIMPALQEILGDAIAVYDFALYMTDFFVMYRGK